MRTETKEFKIYEYKELSDEAKETAYKNWYEQYHDYFWHDDNCKTLEAFLKEFNLTLDGWQYDQVSFSYYLKNIGLDYEEKETSGLRLRSYLLNNYSHILEEKRKYRDKENYSKVLRTSKIYSDETSCSFTGYCADEDILKPIKDFIKKPSGLGYEDLIRECLDNFFEMCSNDYNFSQSEEYFKFEAESNDYEFLESGERY